MKGLLQIDKDGYYSYNSDENFAELNKQQKTFTLYDTPAMKENKGLSGGQFFHSIVHRICFKKRMGNYLQKSYLK